MTPKEKAEDLWVSYYELLPEIYSNEAAKAEAKKYALIAVENEYHSLREQLIHYKGSRLITDDNAYLKLLQQLIDEENEVKTEIEKL